MMLWLGIAMLLAGFALLAVDRKTAHYFRARLPAPLLHFAIRTTDWAKGGPWIVTAAVLYLAVQIWMEFSGVTPGSRRLSDIALALLASLVAGSVVLHSVKIFLGRRRPRDDFEHGLYGFLFFTWDLQYNSFPSGHSLTIFCVAVLASALAPFLWPLWFALAVYLALTRALLTSHFLSDVTIGGGIGVIATREVLVRFFPQFTPFWF